MQITWLSGQICGAKIKCKIQDKIGSASFTNARIIKKQLISAQTELNNLICIKSHAINNTCTKNVHRAD